MLSNYLKDEAIESLIVEELKSQIETTDDPALISAMHTVIAYYSVPGTYFEGAYD
jgi:hypothetical protein